MRRKKNQLLRRTPIIFNPLQKQTNVANTYVIFPNSILMVSPVPRSGAQIYGLRPGYGPPLI